MNVLIDTHLVLWAALAPERLPPRAAKLLTSRSHEVAFSVASLWEISIKSSLGRPDFQVDAEALREGMLDAGFIELDIRPHHVMRVATLPWIHRDPFDRLLVAQALQEGIDLMSADKTLKGYGKVVKSA